MSYRRIVGLGLCVVDHIYVVERLDFSDLRTRFTERLESVGGMTATALAQAAQLGCNTHVLSLVGDDPEGRRVRRALRGAGVKTAGLRSSAAAPTTVAVVLVDRRSGERRFLVPDRRGLERRVPAFELALIDRGTLLLVDGHFPAQALRAVRRARRVGATVVGDFSAPIPSSLRLLPFVDYAIVPEEFVRAYGAGSPRTTLRALRERFGGSPVVTLGARGGLALIDGRVREWRARKVRVRDTTGAGDVFHGAFAAGLYHGFSPATSLDLAARAAALCCTALGGTGRLMRRGELPSRAGRRGRRVR